MGTQTRKGAIKEGFGIEMGGMKREERGNFPEKNFWEQKIKNCAESQSRRAPRAPGGPPPPYNGVFAMFAAM